MTNVQNKKNTFLIVLTLFSAIIISGCGLNLFREDAVKTLASPDNKWIAVVYKSSAGATGASATSVNLFSSSDKIASSSVEPIRKGCVCIVKDHFNIDLLWKNKASLEIKLFAPNKAQIVKLLHEYKGIKISLIRIETTSKVTTHSKTLKPNN